MALARRPAALRAPLAGLPSRRPAQRAQKRAAPAPCRAQGLTYASATEETDDDVEFCAPAFVTHEQMEDSTKLTVRVINYEGLLHVISWVLKGMEVRVRSAKLNIDDEGDAEDVFYLTTIDGNRLSDGRVKDIVERVRAFVMFCQPRGNKTPVEWRNGPVMISNRAHDKATMVTVIEAKKRSGLLLEVVSVMSGVGVNILDVEVHTCTECSDDESFKEVLSDQLDDIGEGRVIRLHLTEVEGGKLTKRSVDAVMFTMSLLLGKGRTETIVPSNWSYATAWEMMKEDDEE